MIRTHVYAPAAAADLREIARYTTKQWGVAQARSYIKQIDDAAAAVASGQGVFRTPSELQPGLLVATSGKHYIFCLPRQGQPALILAVLHERMDLIARLRDRLRA